MAWGFPSFAALSILGPPGVSQADGAGHLVKSLSRRVVPGPSQNLILAVIFHRHQMRVAAGHHQAAEGGLQIRIFNIVGRNMASM